MDDMGVIRRTSPEIGSIVRLLASQDVRYKLAGSLAVNAWGVDVDTPGNVDIVPSLAGTWSDLAPRATRITAYGVDHVLVASVADLPERLTVPRRAKGADRVSALRRMQRAQGNQTRATCP